MRSIIEKEPKKLNISNKWKLIWIFCIFNLLLIVGMFFRFAESGSTSYEAPQIVLTVLLEESGQGSDIAAPIAKEIPKTYFERTD